MPAITAVNKREHELEFELGPLDKQVQSFALLLSG
jgi:hypothetical protein